MTAYEVLDADETHLGVLYFDFFPRAGKSQGAWCGNYVEQTYEEGVRKAPVVSIVCNFTPPVGNTPALLTLDETETLFHEFGHALHFLFHDVKYRGLSEVEGDFVELPSQIMENWAFSPELLRQYAVHYRTGEVIPPVADRQDPPQRALQPGLHDHGAGRRGPLRHGYPLDRGVRNVRSDGLRAGGPHRKTGLIPQIEPRYRYPYFSHIFDGGYSAGYYFYIWAEVLDKDAFEAFRESGDLFNRRVADDFRRKVLSRGGSEDGMSLYRAFRGKDPDRIPMLRGRGLWNEPEPADSLAAPQRVEQPLSADVQAVRTALDRGGSPRVAAEPERKTKKPYTMKKSTAHHDLFSTLAAGCADNSIPRADLPELDLTNPLLAAWDTPHATPPFSRIELKDYEPAFDAAIACSRAEIEAIVSNPKKPTFMNTIVALERQGELLGRISGIFFNLLGANTSDEMQQIAMRVQPS